MAEIILTGGFTQDRQDCSNIDCSERNLKTELESIDKTNNKPKPRKGMWYVTLTFITRLTQTNINWSNEHFYLSNKISDVQMTDTTKHNRENQLECDINCPSTGKEF